MPLISGLEQCPCDNKGGTCKRRGNCELCMENHKHHATKPQVWCQRPANREKLAELMKAHRAKQA